MGKSGFIKYLLSTAMLICSLGSAAGVQPLRADTPREEEKWLSLFTSLISDEALLAGSGPSLAESLRSAMRLREEARPNCLGSWSLEPGAPGFLESATLDLFPQPDAPCDQARFGILTVVLRTARKAADLEALSRDLTSRFGAPTQLDRGAHADLHWQISARAAVEVSVSSEQSEADEIAVRVAQAP